MRNDNVRLISGSQIVDLLRGREQQIVDAIRKAYELHTLGFSSLPHSTFLRFPGNQSDRIIALPAHLGGPRPRAGIKWISSFPGNHLLGLERASALIILNSMTTGRPEAILEGSVISAKRTAASAALAARVIPGHDQVKYVGFVGCGIINLEILQFLSTDQLKPKAIIVYDIDKMKAQQFAQMCSARLPGVRVLLASDADEVLISCDLTSIATTESVPHIYGAERFKRGSKILHISLRDFSPEVILACDNVVDDVAHACREQTSIHLASQQSGVIDFVTCTLGDILKGRSSGRRDPTKPVIFSPFGLGILDLALAGLVSDLACEKGIGMEIGNFFPESTTMAVV